MGLTRPLDDGAQFEVPVNGSIAGIPGSQGRLGRCCILFGEGVGVPDWRYERSGCLAGICRSAKETFQELSHRWSLRCQSHIWLRAELVEAKDVPLVSGRRGEGNLPHLPFINERSGFGPDR